MAAGTLTPYSGNDPYVFVSYSHKDTAKATQIMRMMSEAGVLFWFDKGIDPGSEWDENIAFHVENCGCMVAVVSRNYLQSDNCKDELKFARDLKKEILVVYIENCELPSGIALRLNRRQAINMYAYDDAKEFRKELIGAKVLAPYVLSGTDRKDEEVKPQKEQLPEAQKLVDEDEVQIGREADARGTPLGLSDEQLTGKTLVYGKDAGVTEAFIGSLIQNLYQKGVSFILLSPRGSRYRSLLNYIPDLQLFTPGSPDVVPFPYNPFAIHARQRKNQASWMSRAGYCLQSVLGLSSRACTFLMKAIRAGFAMDAIPIEYDDAAFSSCRTFQLRDVIYRYQELVRESGCSPEEKEELLAEGENKLQAILGEAKAVLDRTTCVQASELLDVPSLIELDSVESPEVRSLIVQLILNQIYVFLRMPSQGIVLPEEKESLNTVIILEEPLLLEQADMSDDRLHHVSVLRLLKEIESTQKIGVISVLSDLAAVPQPILKSFHTKILLPGAEPPDPDEVAYLQGGDVPSVLPDAGEAILVSKSRKRLVCFEPDLSEGNADDEITDEDVAARVWFWLGKEKMLIPFPECWNCLSCTAACDRKTRSAAERIASRLVYRDGRRITTADQLRGYLSGEHLTAAEETERLTVGERIRLNSCVRIHLSKEYYVRKALKLSAADIVNPSPPLSAVSTGEELSLNRFPVGYNPFGANGTDVVRVDLEKHLLYKIVFEQVRRASSARIIETLAMNLSRVDGVSVKVVDTTNIVFAGTDVPDGIRVERTDDVIRSLSAETVRINLKAGQNEGTGVYLYVVEDGQRAKIPNIGRSGSNNTFAHSVFLFCVSKTRLSSEDLPVLVMPEQTVSFAEDPFDLRSGLDMDQKQILRSRKLDFHGCVKDASGTRRPFFLFGYGTP
ncbi:MAG: toll/interleukin-1 receptor domain-containing protein [Clostridia bacterium]|nr:toll/interleukin-1 receptor domain-containing protein [Clostridia bacterium]